MPSIYLKRFLIIDNWTLSDRPQRYLNQNTIVLFQIIYLKMLYVRRWSHVASPRKRTRLQQSNQRVADLQTSQEHSLMAVMWYDYCAFTIIRYEHTSYFKNLSNFSCGPLSSDNHTNFIAYKALILGHWWRLRKIICTHVFFRWHCFRFFFQ